MLETIMKVSGKMFIFVSSINRLSSMVGKTRKKQIMPIVKLLVFIFHDGNRAHFA